jgi:hypothetical protein
MDLRLTGQPKYFVMVIIKVETAFKDGVPGITKYWTEIL